MLLEQKLFDWFYMYNWCWPDDHLIGEDKPVNGPDQLGFNGCLAIAARWAECNDNRSGLSEILADIVKFFDENFDIREHLHLYNSALPFTVRNNWVHSQYSCQYQDAFEVISDLLKSSASPKSDKIVLRFSGPERPLDRAVRNLHLRFSPDSNYLVVRASCEKKFYLLDSESLETVWTEDLPGARDHYSPICFSPDSTRVVWIGNSGEIIQKTVDGKRTYSGSRIKETLEYGDFMIMTNDNRYVVTGSSDSFQKWSIETGVCVARQIVCNTRKHGHSHIARIRSVDPKIILIASYASNFSSLQLWNTETLHEICTWEEETGTERLCGLSLGITLSCSSDSSRLYISTGYVNGVLQAREVMTGRHLWNVRLGEISNPDALT
ncbi:hypothetical protein SISSUDRAFT_1067906 [Sistotremastrum suecicum HHB10207 ss-3]|uniref:WD40 repeat-like protein n=1 Tax=Sistotremastrum suecicum HHB10207 ss-3 TaxID=1314776 RepID=A0A165WKL0_9AGAM|nr:hypothetical protein SISSUDRAFT_1067906 [Sistotremastrum suecicum HHB10207 ss-3]